MTIDPDCDDVTVFAVWHDFQNREQLQRGRPETWRPAVLIDPSHHHIRRADLATFAREVSRASITFPKLGGLVGEIGWESFEVQKWTPDVPRHEATKLRVRVYRQAVQR